MKYKFFLAAHYFASRLQMQFNTFILLSPVCLRIAILVKLKDTCRAWTFTLGHCILRVAVINSVTLFNFRLKSLASWYVVC